MEKKKIKIGLVPKLIIAIIVGILFGQFFPEGFCRFVVTLSGFFSTFLKFVIPLMILAYVTMGIADLSQGAGKLLLITVALAYGSTLIAGSASYLVSSNLFPHFMSEGALDQIAATADIPDTVFQYYPEPCHGYPFCSCPCLCDGPLSLFHAWKRDGETAFIME